MSRSFLISGPEGSRPDRVRETERNVGGRPRTENPLDDQTGFVAPLSELGLSRFMAHRWRVISHCPDDWLREYLEERRAARAEVRRRPRRLSQPSTGPLSAYAIQRPPLVSGHHTTARWPFTPTLGGYLFDPTLGLGLRPAAIVHTIKGWAT